MWISYLGFLIFYFILAAASYKILKRIKWI
uniref:Cytochrome b6-f complex subunit 6 n=2 Tax=Cyanidioschyzon merolae TaxID=45157 RepID=PETL_CYAM1|nr:cytochrome b6/f complex subunit VI [Cyanidioschyzon merolae strain 10D]Q85FP9.1 RecName: Full=Cytochrome b6-f complex subunit 6; AltName: Full=Cytochrome b6-f complex subunit PetL; AltName: Full=Cytochrome b6-f complex subunit VI [Cyanidioschyzon merolae strain 10D]QFV17079.1 cytochrome b6-f complex subunit VI [Cyanidioschyzon merolae]QFV17252.1 cytochrome b6-f complex subunit VI [Cyanidioschyzon merolae]BAC76296.1 cytochrome b6-f complex subunit VI [Cyanidioschyzon merolae strain 10D]